MIGKLFRGLESGMALVFIAILCGLVGVILGGSIGFFYGEQNAYIDFCMDDGTIRYILNDEARQLSCGVD